MCANCARLVAVVTFSVVLALASVHLRADNSGDDDWKAPSRAAARKNPITPDHRSIALGKNVYGRQCLCCHGAQGQGDGPQAKDLEPKPRDLTSDVVTEQTDGTLFWKISHGRKPMPSFEKLTSEDERWDVINYVRTLAHRNPTSQP